MKICVSSQRKASVVILFHYVSPFPPHPLYLFWSKTVKLWMHSSCRLLDRLLVICSASKSFISNKKFCFRSIHHLSTPHERSRFACWCSKILVSLYFTDSQLVSFAVTLVQRLLIRVLEELTIACYWEGVFSSFKGFFWSFGSNC